MYGLLARKPSIIIRDKASKQYSAVQFPLESCNDLSTFSLVTVQLPIIPRYALRTYFLHLCSLQRSPTLNFDEIQGSKRDSGTWLHPARLYSGDEQSFQLHVGRKKIGVN